MSASRIQAAAGGKTQVLEGFSPLAALEHALRYWWFIFLLIVLGGLAGWLIHRVQPPVFEAVATFSAAIDYTSTGPLTQYDEDIAYHAIGALLESTPIVQQVAARANSEGIAVQAQDLKKMIILERQFGNWVVRVRAADPSTAEKLAQAWADIGESAIQAGYAHALQADHLTRTIRALESCLAEAAVSEPANVPCARYPDIQRDLQTASLELARERQASVGIFAGLVPGPVQPVEVPAGPVLYGRNQFVMAGALLGLLAGILFMELKLPARLAGVKQ